MVSEADEADDDETRVPRPLVWLGNSRRKIQAFPVEAQKILGDELQLIQFGGVFEIALRHDAEAYRTVLAVQLGRKI